MFLAFLIFDPNWPFCKGYSLCMGYSLCKMADFQTCLISWIFGVFSSGFLHNFWTTLIFCRMAFSHVFGIFNFWPKLTILQRLCMGYSLCKMADFQTCFSWIFGVFSSGLTQTGFSNVFGIFNFWPKLTILQRL